MASGQRRHSCFNPCCDGTDSSTSMGIVASAWWIGSVSILVVMDRTRRQPASKSAIAHGSRGFNPCCDGTDSSTSPGTSTWMPSWSFNPCCDGTDSSTSCARRCDLARRTGVSILVVMERTRRRPCGSPHSSRRGRCFNPCCDGTDSSTRARRSLRQPIREVSILVVMERTRRPVAPSRRSSRPTRFNPCCDGTDSSTALRA